MLALVLVLVATIFTIHESFMIRQERMRSMIMSAQKWPGDRPPIINPLLLKQKMDASWGRGKYRYARVSDSMKELIHFN